MEITNGSIIERQDYFMNYKMVKQDIYIFTGTEYNSNAILILNNDEAVLVDGLASHADAIELREIISRIFKTKVSYIISTHYFSDHMAAFCLFPKSKIIAHKNFLHTFTSELFRSEEERERFAEPSIVFDSCLQLEWGIYVLNIFHNPGHTLSTVAIDIEVADLIITGDHVFGNVVYLCYSTPEMIREALHKIRITNRSIVITGHNGIASMDKINDGLGYLERLERYVKEARVHNSKQLILNIKIEDCVKLKANITEPERIFHQRNLQLIIDKGLFSK
jgi:glyoxylase-like metal-dependent hydrolase (beta-lactamase superfamily II)